MKGCRFIIKTKKFQEIIESAQSEVWVNILNSIKVMVVKEQEAQRKEWK
jgi:hypothetical protein